MSVRCLRVCKQVQTLNEHFLFVELHQGLPHQSKHRLQNYLYLTEFLRKIQQGH